MKIKGFKLDLSNTEKAINKAVVSIPCRIGQYQHGMDVIEEFMPGEIMKKLRKEALERYLSENPGKKPNLSLPLGFDLGKLPLGAVLTVTEFEEPEDAEGKPFYAKAIRRKDE